MKSLLLKLFVAFTFVLIHLPLISQIENYQKYKIVNQFIDGFALVGFESLPEEVRKGMEKELRRNLFDSEDTIFYSASTNYNYCVRYLHKFYQVTFVIFDSSGKNIHTIVFINPEFSEFSQIYEQISETSYVFPAIESPFGPVRKNIAQNRIWYEVFLGKQGNDDFETVLIFDDHFKQISTERY